MNAIAPASKAAAAFNADASSTAPPGVCLYSAAQAERLVQLSRTTVKWWMTGSTNWGRGSTRQGLRGHPRGVTVGLTFEELLTLRVARGLRVSGMSIRAIQRVSQMASAAFGCPNPMVTQRFRAEGANLILAMEDAARLAEDPDVPEALLAMHEMTGWQRVFADIVDGALFANVDWEAGRVARWWPMGHMRSVVLDPHVLGGAPHIETAQIPTLAIATAARASGDFASVAAAYGVTERQVADAMAFESEWLGLNGIQKWLQPPAGSAIGRPSAPSTATASPAWKRPMRVSGTSAPARAASRAGGTASSTS
jgi:uncharacterized protein (DUF433 family)